MGFLYPSINGVRSSWSEIEFALMTRASPFVSLGIREISYKPTLKGAKVRGAGAVPLGRTRGIADHEGSFTMLKEEADAFLFSLGYGYGEIPFDIFVAYRIDDGTPADLPGQMHQDAILGARIEEVDQSYAQGSDGLLVKFSLSVMDVLLNGLSITSKLAL